MNKAKSVKKIDTRWWKVAEGYFLEGQSLREAYVAAGFAASSNNVHQRFWNNATVQEFLSRWLTTKEADIANVNRQLCRLDAMISRGDLEAVKTLISAYWQGMRLKMEAEGRLKQFGGKDDPINVNHSGTVSFVWSGDVDSDSDKPA